MTFEPKPIRTKRDYQAAMADLRELWELKPKPRTPEFDHLDLLGMLIEAYELEQCPMEAPDAVAAIKFHMDQHDLKPRDLGNIIGSKARASEILNRKRGLSLTQIRRIHDQWHIPADVLISA